MDYTNFEVGQTFPLPIRAQGDGGLFQVDSNGTMFVLQLSRTDIIAIEAFRTGHMQFALYEEDDLLFFLYQIDGIFKEGWGDAPFALHTLKKEQLPAIETLNDPTLHLYLVDSRLNVLLALRSVQMDEKFFETLRRHTDSQLNSPLNPSEHMQRIGKIYMSMSPADMREKASAVLDVPMDITIPKRH
ncbi:hypothetical protein [Schwartzia sp. (in: firmicutes)]